jgi:hypothetical protein
MRASRSVSNTHNSIIHNKTFEFNVWFFLVLVICFLASRADAKYSGGTGEPNNPYRIADANDLNEIGLDDEDWDAHFVLVNDVNLADYNGTQFNIIGIVWDPFTGVFDGNGHTISNFTYTSTGTDYIGIFAAVEAPNSVIKNLRLINPNIDAGTGRYVGSLVGGFADGTILKCGVQGGSISGHRMVGGLVGYNGRDNLFGFLCARTLNSYATATVSGDYEVGGLVGHNGGSLGGAFNLSVGIISNCYTTGDVLAIGEPNGNIGGLVGFNNDLGSISNCYSAGMVVGGSAGGLVGVNLGIGTVTACFWDVESSGVWDGVGIGSSSGITGKTTAEMKKENTFTDAGWDFVEIWDIGEAQTYPFLRTHSAGDLNHDGIVNFIDVAILAGHWLEEK